MPSLPPNPPSSRPSTIPLPIWQPTTRSTQFNFDGSSFPRSRSPATSYEPWGWIKKSACEALSGRNLTGIEHPLHPLGRWPPASYLQPSETRSNPMPLTHGMLAHQGSTTTRCFLATQGRDTAWVAEPTNYSWPTLAYYALTISKNDHTIMAAMNILEIFKNIVLVSAIEKRTHCKMLRSLTGVLAEYQTPRQNRWTPKQMEDVPPSRVDATSNSRVNTTPTLSTDNCPQAGPPHWMLENNLSKDRHVGKCPHTRMGGAYLLDISVCRIVCPSLLEMAPIR